MLLSLAVIILLGFALQGLLNLIKLPGLLGYLIAGLALGPFALNLISPDVLGISADLRKIALIVILVRAGLALDLRDLRRVGRPAILLGFIPATLEIGGAMLLASMVFGLPLLEAALLGAALAAVSPAIVIPAMLRLMDSGRGRDKGIPQMIMAGATVDNIFVVIVFTVLLSTATGGTWQPQMLFNIPLSIMSGLAVGVAVGLTIAFIFKKFHLRDTVKVILVLGLSFLIVGAENLINRRLPFSAILAVVALAVTLSERNENLTQRLSGKFGKLWVGAELILFVMVGALVDLRVIWQYLLPALVIVVGVMIFRTAGVVLSTIRTGLNARERAFVVIASLPKASLQAVLGALPLAAGLGSGQFILAVSIVAIILTAPAGSIAIDKTSSRLLSHSKNICEPKVKKSV